MKLSCLLPFAPLLFLTAAAQQLSMVPTSSALEPSAALAAFEVAPGFRVELVASEPLVFSPVAMAFDSRGRLAVVEMRGYPLGNIPGEKGIDTIALLEDTNGDGRMDKRTVFADGLVYPNGILPWKDGYIVTCAPDVLFLRDTDGDGRADERRVLLTGFSTTRNAELRVNDPTVGPDGWIYLAAGLSGGTITAPDYPERAALNMTADVRFHPETLVVEHVDGKSQFGMSFDSAGRRFICINRVPVQHVVLSARWLQRNPNLELTETVQDCNERSLRNTFRGGIAGGAGVKLFPISSHFVNVDSDAGSFTAACGLTIWRDGSLTETYRGAAFSCDPTANLVHVDRLMPRGATFAAEPILPGREFLASRDNWFRPVFLSPGPQGGLYVVDMYRKIIEHADFLPEEIRKYADVNAGRDRGRIWRVVPKSGVASLLPSTSRESNESWAEAPRPTDHAAAQRWLEERVQATRSADPRTRFLGALALGTTNHPQATAALAEFALRDMPDRWARAAVLSSAAGREVELLNATITRLDPQAEGVAEFLNVLGRGVPDLDAIQTSLTLVSATKRGNKALRSELLGAALLVGYAEKNRLRFDSTAGKPWLEPILQSAMRGAANASHASPERITQVRLLARTSWERAGALLIRLAHSDPDEAVRSAAIRSLTAFNDRAVARALMAPKAWAAATPTQRTTILNALLTSEHHRLSVLDALEAGILSPNAVTGLPRQQFVNDKDPATRRRAQEIWGNTARSQGDAAKAAKSVLALKGNSNSGRDVFRSVCTSCHRLDQEGHNVGPDLADMRRQAKETILYHIVSPDADILPVFASYAAETKDGRSLSGILSSETPASITLLGPMGHQETIRRNELVRLESLPNSMMPTGLAAAMTPQQLADLLAYLRGEK